MKKIVLVAGSDHRTIADLLQQLLRPANIQLQTVTMKSQRDILLRLAEESSQAIWLVSPQTVEDKRYTAIRQLLQRNGISVIPVSVTPVEKSPFSQAPIQFNQNHNITATEIIQALDTLPQRMTPSRLAFGIMLVFIVLILGLSSLFVLGRIQNGDASLPTFVALNSQSLAIVNTTETSSTTVTVTEKPSVAISSTTPTEITPETTVEVDDLLLTSDVEPESTEAVDVEVTDEPQDTVSLDVGGILLADFSADPQRGDAPLSVKITNLSTGNISAYRWDYETDGTIDNSDFEPPTITYNTPGIYTLTLMTRDVNGVIVESESIIEVYAGEDSAGSSVSSGSTFASFETSPSSGQFPLSVRFINRSVGSNLKFEWDFNGDSQVDFIGPSPSAYVFKKPGTYTARLETVSPNGIRERAQTQINVYSSSPDNANEIVYDVDSRANFEVSPSTGTIPFRVTIINLSVGGNNSYEWDFNGDSIPDSASAQPSQQRYAVAGVYTISLTVYGFDRYGNSKISRAQTQVQASKVKPNNVVDETYEEFGLEADFVANISQGTAPLTVEFYNYSTGDIVSYQWDFNNDGVFDSGEFEPIHTFTNAGNYEVLLRVSDGLTFSETSFDIEVIASAATKTTIPNTVVPKTATPTVLPTIGGTSGATLTFTATPTLTITANPNITVTTQVPSPTSNGTGVTATPNTPTVTPMPSATHTPIPTNTPMPTATHTPIPTNTPLPTATHTPIPTNTPVPTATPAP